MGAAASYLIRPATAYDLPAVRDVLVATWHASYDHIFGAADVTAITDVWHALPALARDAGRPGVEFLVAQTPEHAIVATSLARLTQPGGADGVTVTLSRFYILPEHQRTGLGARLLAATLAPFASAKLVTLEVDPQNAPAIAFYQRHGFRRAPATQNCGAPSPGSATLTYQRAL
jgi:ribosomal protein S18 acetylase RimI-like enzyme